MILIIYRVFIYLIQPIIWLYLLWRSYKLPAYRKRWNERYGFCAGKIIPGGILLHSVSVGETLAAVPLIKELRYRYPTLPITVTTITPTGSEQVISRLGNDVQHVYLPYDLIGSVRRFLNYVNPKLTIIMETELWPNFILQLKQRKIPLIIANARLSESSASRYQKLGFFIQKILQKTTLIAAQNKEDGERFVNLGLTRKKLSIIGNLKFNISVTPEITIKSLALRKQWGFNRPVWIASSIHKKEELIILQTHKILLKEIYNLLLIIVPRHPERFKKIKKLIQKTKLNYICRSEKLASFNKNIQVVIGDTMGELMLLYGVADLAFIGGSLIKKGGHNPLEAAAHKLPILMGPHTFNFKDICNKLKQSGGLITVKNSKSLIYAIIFLLKNKDQRLCCGYQAAKVLYNNQGALQKLLKLLTPYISLIV